MWEYSDKVKDHYLNPHNVGEVENPDGIGEIGNLKCGDALRLTFKLNDEGRIEEAKFKTFGCGSAIASSSVLTDLIIGKTLEEAEKITNQEIADELGGLPSAKMHCSVMGEEALEEAIAYYRNGGKPVEKKHTDEKMVCACFSVTDHDIIHAIKENNLTTVEEITNYTKAGGGCGGCIGEIENILEKINGPLEKEEEPQKEAPVQMTNLQKITKIQKVLAEDVDPLLKRDGGGVELIDVDGNKVIVRFLGACTSCPSNAFTQTSVVEKTLQEKVLPDLEVVLG